MTVCGAPGDGVHLRLDEAGGHAQGPVNGQHPLAVAAGQVVVDGDDVDTLADQGVEVGGEDAHQRLALAGGQLGDGLAVQHGTGGQLHVEGPQADDAVRRHARQPERLRQQPVQ